MKTNFIKTKLTLALGFFFISLLACNAFNISVTSTATLPTLPPATSTALPLSQQVTISIVNFSDSGQSPAYTINAQIPAILGNNDPRALAFNGEMHDFAQGLIDDFKKKLAQNPITPITAASYLDVKFSLVSPPGNFWSIKYETEGYLAGMAHPYHLSYSFNYDLDKGKAVAFADLFLPGTDYLGAISKYCVAQLSTRDIDFKDFTAGANPTPDNYKNWNITADGLMITFDEYQVAPYAAGPQVVTVPYSDVKSLIDPKGPLTSFVH